MNRTLIDRTNKKSARGLKTFIAQIFFILCVILALIAGLLLLLGAYFYDSESGADCEEETQENTVIMRACEMTNYAAEKNAEPAATATDNAYFYAIPQKDRTSVEQLESMFAYSEKYVKAYGFEVEDKSSVFDGSNSDLYNYQIVPYYTFFRDADIKVSPFTSAGILYDAKSEFTKDNLNLGYGGGIRFNFLDKFSITPSHVYRQAADARKDEKSIRVDFGYKIKDNVELNLNLKRDSDRENNQITIGTQILF